MLFYFSGYQPTLDIPPITQSIVKAEFSQEQIIQNSSFKDPFILPHPGYKTTSFSAGHPGVDIATGLGMPIHPINSGKIIEVSFGYFGLGHYVVIEHEQGIKSTYGHMGRIFVKKDDIVTQNSILGEVGMTGRTSGPHTHLETTKNGEYFNPELILPKLLPLLLSPNAQP
ncbi:MAG: M23 family metallopeptidase [Candidatus Daviesbacteria bacterium]|nr:M23 family metallopeptidase [Candidatus Daviesbacteria bacterium]